MNVADSNDVAERLFTHGFQTIGDPGKADLIIVNTCSVREHAERRARVRIAEFCRMKKPGAQLWVIGCMAERLGERLMKDIPGVDRVIGARSLGRIDEITARAFPGQHADFTGIETTGEASDFISIMRGCNNYCSYCIVPYVRGPESSIPAATIIDAVRKKAGQGVREVTLLGQNVNSYCDAGIDFPDLIREVAAVEGIKRIRFTTSHPKDCCEKLIRTIADEPKCCRHIHLPVQSGSDRVLSLMNRRYSAADYRDRIMMIRSLLPKADITTDFLVGFPSETDADFEATLALVEEVRFTGAFMFAYSVREGTVAANFVDTVADAIKRRRLKMLIDRQTAITKEKYSAMVGRKVQLMIRGRQLKRDRLWMARDYGCKRALIACDDVQAGTILQAEVVRTSGMTIICERTAP
ncbi:MAG: tRNA (N6-isopentenyl adenosine(37)-C2)-methylthiotransferase MiaB [Chitinispirillaceae bacterium]|nr:tRNA (N6-isopentenyl adenosine(37)-C2)-methylthiotransferase MiaB [Chitinispirillaceae bacterium]